MRIRQETPADYAAVEQVLLAAFETDDESRLVSQLRSKAAPLISLVAEEENQITGHILFSPVTLDTDPSLQLMGLAPMAVMPEFQRSGVGAALINSGLKHCRQLQIGAVVVLGHPDYYPRFGFNKSTDFGIHSEYDVPPEVFMLKELRAAYLDDRHGTVSYHEEFGKL